MSYNQRRYETLRRLGIEQLPTLRISGSSGHVEHPCIGDMPVRTMPVSSNQSRICLRNV